MYSHKISLEVYTRLDMTILQQANETHLCRKSGQKNPKTPILTN